MKKNNIVAIGIAIVGGVLGAVANLVQDDADNDKKDAFLTKVNESKKREDAE